MPACKSPTVKVWGIIYKEQDWDNSTRHTASCMKVVGGGDQATANMG